MKNSITTLMNELSFKRLINSMNIEPAPLFDIVVKDAKIVKPQTNVERYYDWLVKIGNIYLHDHAQVIAGFKKIANN
jgi:hypothetical protein